VLTELKAYSAWESVPTLPLSDTGRAETDLIQITNIEGLDPVKADISTSPLGSGDGVSHTGSKVASRNIVLTLHPNPNWDTWTHASLRRLLYSYFTPKQPVRLEFYSDDMIPVAIDGVVESAEDNRFSKDPELIVSVICPDPYFIALEPTILTGLTINPIDLGTVVEVDYKGNVEAGIHVEVSYSADPVPGEIDIQIGDPDISFFRVISPALIDPNKYLEMSSFLFQKFVQNVDIGTGVITSLLSKTHIREGSAWPMLRPGLNKFYVLTDIGEHAWELTYYQRFGGL
jgi:hypothetical protein